MRLLRAVAARLGLVLAGLAAGVALAEVAARLLPLPGGSDLLLGTPDATPEGLYVVDPVRISVPTPNFRGVARAPGWTVEVRTDALGLRGGGLRGRRPLWLALGDSFVMALQVREEDTFCARLGRLLGGECANAGVDGYGAEQARLRHADLAPRLRPDGVLLVFFLGNDFIDDEEYPARRASVASLPAGSPVPRPPRPALERWLGARSWLFARWVAHRRASSPEAWQVARWRRELELFSAEGAPALERAAEASRRALRGLRDQARARGERLVVASAPPAFAVERERLAPTFALVGLDPARADLDAPGRALARILGELGVEHCPLEPALAAARAEGRRVYLRADGHWSAEGHEVVAEALAGCLSSSR